MKLLSIIVPVYNVEKYLERCVKSIINQTYSNIEIILVDDGSTDHSSKMCDDFKKDDNRIKVIHKENGGLSDARNCGLNYANGDYILYVDSDDYIDTDTCSRFAKAIEKIDNVDIITGNAILIENGKMSPMNHSNYANDNIVSSVDYLKNELKNHTMYMAAWLNLYKRDFLIKNNLYFKKGILHEDEELIPQVFLKANKISHIDFPFYFYEIREGSITQKKDLSKNANDLFESLNSLEKKYNSIEDKELRVLLKDSLAEKYLNMFQISKKNTKNKIVYDKDFVKRNAYTRKNKIKSSIFFINKNLYYYLNILQKNILNDYKIIKENNKLISFFLIFCMFFQSRFFVFSIENFDSAKIIYMWLSRITTIIIIICYYKFIMKQKQISGFTISIFIVYLVMFIMNFFNNGELRTVLSISYPILSLIMAIEICFEYNYKSSIVILNHFFGILITANFIFKLFLPSLFGEFTFLLGPRNQIGILLMIYIFVTYLYKNEFKQNLYFIFSLIISLLTILIGESANNLIAISLIFLFLIVNYFIDVDFSEVSIFGYVISYLTLFCSIVIFRIQSFFSFFIEGVLHRSLSLSGRTYIWDVAFEKILMHPLIGNGRLINDNYFYVNYLMKNNQIKEGFYSAHNTFIQICYESGMITIFAFLFAFIYALKKIKSFKVNSTFFYVCMFSVLLINMMEAIGFDGIFFLLSLYYFYLVSKYKLKSEV